MGWTHVASKDFHDAIRSRMLWVVTGLLVLLTAGTSAIPRLIHEDGPEPEFTQGIEMLYLTVGLLVPIIGLVVGYRAVVGERESGSIRTLLGLPNSRLDVIVGKTVGRVAVMTVATVAGILAGTVVLLALYDGFDIVDYAAVGLHVLLGAVLFVVLAIVISASVASSAKAAAAIFGVYVGVFTFWEYLPDAVYWAVEGTLPGGGTPPAWYVFLGQLNPGQALDELLLVPLDVFADAPYVTVQPAAERVPGDAPFYLESWFAAVVFLAWIAVPLAIGYVRFRNATLN